MAMNNKAPGQWLEGSLDMIDLLEEIKAEAMSTSYSSLERKTLGKIDTLLERVSDE